MFHSPSYDDISNTMHLLEPIVSPSNAEVFPLSFGPAAEVVPVQSSSIRPTQSQLADIEVT